MHESTLPGPPILTLFGITLLSYPLTKHLVCNFVKVCREVPCKMALATFCSFPSTGDLNLPAKDVKYVV